MCCYPIPFLFVFSFSILRFQKLYKIVASRYTLAFSWGLPKRPWRVCRSHAQYPTFPSTRHSGPWAAQNAKTRQLNTHWWLSALRRRTLFWPFEGLIAAITRWPLVSSSLFPSILRCIYCTQYTTDNDIVTSSSSSNWSLNSMATVYCFTVHNSICLCSVHTDCLTVGAGRRRKMAAKQFMQIF